MEGGLCLREVLEAMRSVLLCMLEAVEGELFAGGDAQCATLYAGGGGGDGGGGRACR